MGFSRAQMGEHHYHDHALLAYACGQIINGLITDRIGGKKAMLIGAAGTVTDEHPFWRCFLRENAVRNCSSPFAALRCSYLQSFGAPGMVKMNAAWFAHRERGRFSGIYAFYMINRQAHRHLYFGSRADGRACYVFWLDAYSAATLAVQGVLGASVHHLRHGRGDWHGPVVAKETPGRKPAGWV